MDNIPILAFPSHLRDHICPTPHILIIMAKTLGTNPHSQDPPPRRSNRNAPRKSPVGKKAPGRKGTAAARKATLSTLSTRKKDKTTLSTTRKKDKTNTSARANTAPHDSDSESSNFSGQRKAPPELIAPAQAVEPHSMPTRKTAAARKTPPLYSSRPSFLLLKGAHIHLEQRELPLLSHPSYSTFPTHFSRLKKMTIWESLAILITMRIT